MVRKNTLKKLLVSILIFLTLFNFLVSIGGPTGIVLANDPDQTDIETIESNAETLINARNNGITGILTWLLKIIVIGMASTFQIETFFIADSAGNNGSVTSAFVTPLDIFFNRFTLTDINIFTTDGLSPDGLVYKIRSNAAMWYFIFRAIALAILLIMLIYDGIKLLASNLADERAKYKRLMVDWVVSLVLVMFMHMIIIVAININQILVGVIEQAAGAANVSNIMDQLMTAAFSDNYLIGMASTIVYVLMVVQTIIYLFIYIKRFLVTLFLVIISPIIPITYSFDRANGGTAKALNGWLREFMYNVFVQLLHCVIYVVIVGVALSALASQSSVSGLEDIGAGVIAIFSMLFIRKAEALLREILGFNKATTVSSHNSIVNSAVNIGATGVAMAAGGAAAPGITNARFGQNISNTNNNNTNNSWLSNASNYVYSKIGNITNNFGNPNDIAGGKLPDLMNSNDPSKDAQENAPLSEADSAPQLPASTEGAGTGTVMPPPMAIPIIAGTGSETQKSMENLQKAIEESQRNENKNIEKNERNEKNSRTERTEYINLNGNKGEGDKPEKDQFDELKEKLDEIENNIKEVMNMQKDLDELEKQLKDEGKDADIDTIKNNIDKIMLEADSQSAMDYANSLDGQEKDYALQYIQFKQLDSDLDTQVDNFIDQAREQGLDLSKDDEAALMAGGSIAMKALNRIKDNNSIESNVENDESEETEEIQLPDVEIENVLNESTKTDLGNNRTVRDETMKNLKLLELFEGKAIIEGELTDEALNNFNIEVLTKVKQGSYSESNFKAAEDKVKKEGNAAVRRLEEFKRHQSEANARALSPAGKEYAKLMLEAEQAGMVLTAVREVSEQNIEFTKNVRTETIRNEYGQNLHVPSNRTNDVLQNLNGRKANNG